MICMELYVQFKRTLLNVSAYLQEQKIFLDLGMWENFLGICYET